MRYCKKCGVVLKKGYSFCGKCGQKYGAQSKQRPPAKSGSSNKSSLTQPSQVNSSSERTASASSPSSGAVRTSTGSAKSPSTKAIRPESRVTTQSAKQSKSPPPETKQSKSTPPEAKKSKSPLPEMKQSKSSLPETKQSKSTLSETKKSKSPLPETKQSKSPLSETKKSKSPLPGTKKSKSTLSETKQSKSPLPETRKSYSVDSPSKEAVNTSSPRRESTSSLPEKIPQLNSSSTSLSSEEVVRSGLGLAKSPSEKVAQSSSGSIKLPSEKVGQSSLDSTKSPPEKVAQSEKKSDSLVSPMEELPSLPKESSQSAINEKAQSVEEKPKNGKMQLRIVLLGAMTFVLIALLVISYLIRPSGTEEAGTEGFPRYAETEACEYDAIAMEGEAEGSEEWEEAPEEGEASAERSEATGEWEEATEEWEEDPAIDESEVGELEKVVVEDVLGKWLWIFTDRDEGNFAYNLMTHYFGVDGTGKRSINGEHDMFSWGTIGEGILAMTWVGGYVEKWAFTVQEETLLLQSKQMAGMEFVYRQIATEGQAELFGRWGWNIDNNWYYLFEMDGYGSRTDANFQGRDEFAWFLLADGGIVLRIGEERVEFWCYEINYNMLTLASRQERGIVFHYIRLE